jgi:type I restriction enzyme S subunit
VKYKQYSSYKDSGIEWLGEIPSEWKSAKLKYYLAKLIAGGTPKTDNDEYWSEEKGIAWVSIADMTKNSYVTETKKNVTNKGIINKNLKVLPPETILYSIFASLGKVAITKIPVTTNQAILGMVPNHNIDKSFFYWFLIALEDYVKFTASSNTQDNLNSEKVGNFPISIPLQEQQQIANFLDNATAKIDNLIDKQTKLCELLKEKRQAVISNAVTKGLDPNVPMKDSGVEWLGEIPEHWKISRLRYIFSFSKGLTITKADLKDEGIPCVSYGEVHSKYGFEVSAEKHPLKCVDDIYLKTSKVCLMSKGDFIFADTSEDLDGAGNFSHLSGDTNVFAGYHSIIARQTKNNNFLFLAYLLDSLAFRTQIRLSVKGVKVFSITQAILRASPTWLPPIEEQQQIANYLDDKTSKIDSLVEKSNKSIELFKEKRTALISATVMGKIDVRGMV